VNGGDFLKRDTSQKEAESATYNERQACVGVCEAMGWHPEAGTPPNWTKYLTFVRAVQAAQILPGR
jgi:hypothetical protein